MFKQLTLVLLLLAGVHHGVNGLPQSKVKKSSRRDGRRRLNAGNGIFTHLLQEVCYAGQENNWDLSVALAGLSFDHNNTATPILLTGSASTLLISFTTEDEARLPDDVLNDIVGEGMCTFYNNLKWMEEWYCDFQSFCQAEDEFDDSNSHDIVKADGVLGLMNSQGNVFSEAAATLRSDHVTENYGLTGAGLKIGIISDSMNKATNTFTTYADDVADGEIPDDIEIIQDGQDGYIDEGRAMAQLIHDIVPDASIAFRTGFLSPLDMANGIAELVDAGCNVIVDDVKYFVEPYFTDGVIAQAAAAAVNKGVAYFSSAGNQGRNSWEDTFRATKDPELGAKFNAWFAEESSEEVDYNFTQADFHDFGGGQTMQKVTGSDVDNEYLFILQWDDVWSSLHDASPQTDLDFFTFYYDKETGEIDIQRVSMADNINSSDDDYTSNGDPYEYLAFNRKDLTSSTIATSSDGDPDVYLAIVKVRGSDNVRMKWIEWWNEIIDIEPENGSFAGTVYGHQNAEGVVCVGAANYDDTLEWQPFLHGAILKDYSSAGGTPVIRDTDGTPMSERIGGVSVVGPDKVKNSFFGSNRGSYYRFYGTSAAAPNVASVALQMLGANPALTPADITSILEGTADDMVERELDGQPDRLATLPAGADEDSGHGFVNAESALAVICPAQVTVALNLESDDGNGESIYAIDYTLTSNCNLPLTVVDVSASSTCDGQSVSLTQSKVRIKNEGGCSIQENSPYVDVDAGVVTVTVTAAFVDGSTLTFSDSASATSSLSTPGPTPGPAATPTPGPTPGPAATPATTPTGGSSDISPLSSNLRHPHYWAYTRGGLRIYCQCQWCHCKAE